MLNNPSRSVLSSRKLEETQVQWKPPSLGTVKINFDASINQDDGIVGLGFIARNHAGECEGWSSQCVSQYLDSNSAEGEAAFLAVDLARRKGWRKIVIEGDSSVVIEAVSRDQDDRSIFGNIVSDIHGLAGYFDELCFQHVRREGNIAAHEVARLSFKGPHCFGNLPEMLQQIVSSESSFE